MGQPVSTNNNPFPITTGKITAASIAANSIYPGHISPLRASMSPVQLSDLNGMEALKAIQTAVTDVLDNRLEEAEATAEDDPDDEHVLGELYALRDLQKALKTLFGDLPRRLYSKYDTPRYGEFNW